MAKSNKNMEKLEKKMFKKLKNSEKTVKSKLSRK